MPIFVDRDLARRLERTEGFVSTTFAVARAQLDPAAGAEAREIAGAFAIFDGPDSPITQTFGLGMSAPISAADVAAIEAFFDERGAATHHEVCPLAGVETYALLAERGYRPVELSNVLARELDDVPPAPAVSRLRVRAAEPHEASWWVEAAVSGWAESAEYAEMIRGFTRVAFANASMTSFVAEIDGAIVATGSLAMHEGIALFAGASTVPTARKQGAQRALLAERLAEAKRRGCVVAMMAAAPGSTSQRNAERNGFGVAYSRTKWRREARAVSA